MEILISYDYEDFIKELMEEVLDGVLSLNDHIQVLRKKPEGYNNLDYEPIIDWDYSHEIMVNDILVNDEIDPFDSVDETENEKIELERMKEQYFKDRPSLVTISVENVLIEMLAVNKIL